MLLELESKEADCFTLFPAYIQYIEDIEDRMDLELAIQEHKTNGEKLIDFDEYDKEKMK